MPRRLPAVAGVAALALSACGTQGPVRSSDSPARSGSAHATAATTTAAHQTGPVACSSSRLPRHKADATFSVRLGGATGTLTGRVGGDRWQPTLIHPRLSVTSGGRVATTVLQPATSQGPDPARQYFPTIVAVHGSRPGYVCLARFGAHPVAVVSIYSGGAHCCTTLRLLDAAGHESRLDTGNVGAALAVVDGRLLLRTGDDTFSYTFADFADSCAPVQLLRPAGEAFTDVTRRHPAVLTADAGAAMRLARQRPIRLGFLACWAADQERLGHDERVWRTLAALQREGELKLPSDLTGPGWWKDGPGYVAQLRDFLTKRGYRSS